MSRETSLSPAVSIEPRAIARGTASKVNSAHLTLEEPALMASVRGVVVVDMREEQPRQQHRSQAVPVRPWQPVRQRTKQGGSRRRKDGGTLRIRRARIYCGTVVCRTVNA